MRRIYKTLFPLLILVLFSCKAQESLVAEGAELTLVADTFSFTEGPAADSEGNIYFTDQPNDRIHKWDASTGEITVYMEPAGRANGLYVDRDGKLLACADEKFELWRISPDKEVEVLANEFKGKDFNGPNDVWVAPNGGIYFTDPYYQRPYWERQKPDMEAQNVYYLAPGAREPKLAADNLVQPNGIIGTPDGKTLYVADIGDKKTYAYTIGDDGSLEERLLVTGMGSDGMTLDERGNLYLTGNGVTVFKPGGEQLQHIEVPQRWTANVTFGGPENKTLFITAMNSVYTLDMNVEGIHRP